MFKISDKTFVSVMTLIYAGIVIFISSFHVVWRNEVVPMTVAIQSSSLADLSLRIHSFGHPILWYAILYLVHQVIHPYWVLKVVNILICVGAIYIFLANSPFSRQQKILFVLGFFPLYLYPVFNCNYGISMLLLFIFASLYPHRFEKMVPIGGVLFMLANVHAHSLITVMAILAALAAEFLFCPKSRQEWLKHLNQTIIGFILILVGIVYCVIQIIPDHNNIIFSPHPLGIKEIISTFVKSVIFPGKAFISVLGGPDAIFTTFVVICMYVYLITKPYLFVLFSFAVIILSMFYHLIFQSDDLRHQGALYLLFITVLWLDGDVQEVRLGKALEKFRNSIVRYKESFLLFLLVLQICMAYPAIANEITSVYSSSKSIGAMLNENPQYKNAILIGEPGSMLEAIPYYADNAMYLPREGKFKKYTEFTTNQKLHYSLKELLAAARNVKSQTGKMVLIVMGHKLSYKGPFLFKFSHNRTFSCTKESLDEFFAQTRRIAVFRESITDENYSVYLLK